MKQVLLILGLSLGLSGCLEGPDKYTPTRQETTKINNQAKDYCEESSLENADLEVIIYNSQIAGINVLSWDPNIKNEVYNFTNSFIGSLGSELEKDRAGFKNLSLGNLLIVYSKYEHQEQIYEVLEITNNQLKDFVVGEQVLEANG